QDSDHSHSGDILQLLQMEQPGDYISSVAWIKEGSYPAVGTSSAEVQLWDVQQQKRYILCSGSRSGHVPHHDVRVAEHHVATLSGHSQEVCALRWAPEGQHLASGGNDNLSTCGLVLLERHQEAVKAVAWCPWQPNVLATGGGTSDRHIRIWNVCSGACLSAVDAHSQVRSILWSPHYKELISGHGFAQNQLVIWKYPTMANVAELKGHTAQVLSLTMSPDGATVASAAAAETLRLWRCFELDPAWQREREMASTAKSSLIHQGIC
uniref:CDC20/Fizzy WD40 domain-containing protein n=1 Tax=Balaenoptera musculus TaxID=9771 RepID=A0A8C0DQS2_BALMU